MIITHEKHITVIEKEFASNEIGDNEAFFGNKV